jgi:large subunit ribosomal protein L10
MPSQKNIDQVKNLTEKLSQAKAVILSDYAGLSVSQQAELRQKVKDSGGQFLVAKNRLFKLAYQEKSHLGGGRMDSSEVKKVTKQASLDLAPELEDSLRGPTGFLFAYEDEIGPIKALVQFAQKHELPSLKIGLILKPEDRILTIEEIEELAKLSTREELIARLISSLNAPRYKLVYALSGNLQKLLLVLGARQKNLEYSS